MKTTKVKSINKVGTEEVFDITTRRHNFVLGNGLVVHNSMATPHVSGLVSLMEQSFRERLGKKLSIKEIKRMMGSLGHSKRNDSGYGLITWDKWEKWMDTEYGVRL